MFQSYEAPETRQSGAGRIDALRHLMAKAKVDAVLVPRSDEHQGEYVAPSAERLRWLTGFSGSAGLAVVARSAAALFVDGRYLLQAPAQVDTHIVEVLQIPDAKIADWLGRHVKTGGSRRLRPEAAHRQHHRGAGQGTRGEGHQAQTPRAQSGRPRLGTRAPASPARRRDAASDQICGQDGAGEDRRPAVHAAQGGRGRGGAHPARIRSPGCSTFAAPTSRTTPCRWPSPSCLQTARRRCSSTQRKIGQEAKAHWGRSPSQRARRARDAAGPRSRARASASGSIRRPPRAGSFASSAAARPASCAGPIPAYCRRRARTLPRSRACARRTSATAPRWRASSPGSTARRPGPARRDRGLARARSLPQRDAGAEGDQLRHHLRRRPQRRHRPLPRHDSDQPQARSRASSIWSTPAPSTWTAPPTSRARSPSASRRARCSERFTLVLKGHIAHRTARFPKGTRGVELDAFARRALWEAGVDYDHGTGHGVGCYLSVHEGPQGISSRAHDRRSSPA